MMRVGKSEHRLAVFTVAVLRQPRDHPASREFLAADPEVFAAAEAAPGFIARSGHPEEPDHPSWGPFEVPAFVAGDERWLTPQTLSLWTDPEALAAFTFRGPHGAAMRHRHAWFAPRWWPSHVMWWLDRDAVPSWHDGCLKLRRLHEQGPTPEAFDFARLFDAQAQPSALDRARLEALRAAGGPAVP